SGLGVELVKRVSDPDIRVRMQLAYTLGEWDDPKAGRALGELAVRDQGDPYLLAAITSSISKKNLDQVLVATLKSGQGGAPPAALVERLLNLATALGHRRVTVTLLDAVATPEKEGYAAWQFGALATLLDGLDQRSSSLAQLAKEGEQRE